MYIIIAKVEGYIEESNGNKSLVFTSTDKNKEVLTKYGELWDGNKNLIKTMNSGETGEHGKDFMKIKFNWNDDFPLNKILKLHNLTVVVKSFFQEDNKYYPQVFLDECFYEL